MISSGRENAEATRKLEEEIVQNDRELAHLRDMAAERKGTTTGNVVTVLNARTAISTELQLTYSTYDRVALSFWMA